MNLPSASLPTRYGDFDLKIFKDSRAIEHMVLIKGTPAENCLVRIHSECATGDILGSLRCDCRDQLEESMEMIARAGSGLLIYVRGHEGRGIGLGNKIRAYALQEKGLDTYDANVHLGFAPDAREYGVAIDILKRWGLKKIQLITNNGSKISALEKAGIAVSRRVPLWTTTNPHNEGYINTKRVRMGHL